MKKPLILCILDGWGVGSGDDHDAIAGTSKPHYDAIVQHSSVTTLDASGLSVGLPQGQMGNSEVGHMTIGAGRIIYQDLPRINQAIATDALGTNKALTTFIQQILITDNKCIHLIGLLSDGGIHSHQTHIHALIDAMARHPVQIKLHVVLDGRDTPPQNAHHYTQQLLDFIADKKNVSIATMGGRFFMMDRDQRWERVHQAYKALQGQADTFTDPLTYINNCHQQDIGDEFTPPAHAPDYSGFKPGDGLLCGNFRADRVRQIMTALIDPDFKSFERGPINAWSAVTGLTVYSKKLTQFMSSLFPPQIITNTLGEVLAKHNLRQLRIAETEKYAHVSFFFNAGREDPFPQEDRILVQSPKVTTYDLKPEMSAYEITDHIIDQINQDRYDVIIVNYANADMVGHTGDFNATSQAIIALDHCLGRLKTAIDQKQGILVITADHGNADCMYNPAVQQPHTAHTQNHVPFIIYHPDHSYHLSTDGNLSNIAPTVLNLLGLTKPVDMTSSSLLTNQNTGQKGHQRDDRAQR